MTERRRYFRVDDLVSMQYRVVKDVDLQQCLDRLDRGIEDGFTVTSSLTAINQQLRSKLAILEKKDADLADYLRAMERKIDLLAHAIMSKETTLEEMPTREVNLSAVGMAFRSEAGVEVDKVLEIRMLLYPSLTGILTYGTVVHCREEGDDEYPWRIAVDFSFMRESDRDILINHILKRQHSQLREQRLGKQ